MLCQGFQHLTSGRFQKWVLWYVPNHPKQVLAVSWCRKWRCGAASFCLLLYWVTPVGTDQGLPMHDVTASSGPTVGHSTIRKTGGASGRTCSRKGRKYWAGRGGEGKKGWGTTGFKNKAGGEGAPDATTDTTAWWETIPGQTSLTRTVASGKPWQSRGKVSEGGSSR